MKLKHKLACGWTVAFSAVLAACGGGGGGDGSAGSTGTLRLALTDAPACGYDAVWVTVKKVRVHQSAQAGANDAGWSELTLASPQRVDLLHLRNGVLAELGQMPLQPGRYQQLRLVLADDSEAATGEGESGSANAIVPTGGSARLLETPSALQSGLKLNVDLLVEADRMVDLVLDMDACKSVVRNGNSGRYTLKPVVSVIPRYVSGVRGALAVGWPAGTTQVSLQQAGAVVKSTSPDGAGGFVLQPVAPGSYTLVIAGPGQTTHVVTGVTVAADTVTALNTTVNAIAPLASPTGIAAGRVTLATAGLDATTRALQTLAGGATIEVAGAPVDAATGDYSHVLPVAAPRVAAFGATLGFAADAAAAGRYAVQAAAGDLSKTVGPFTLGAAATVTNDIALP